MCYIARIETFLERWPDAEHGPGHIVLGDANIEDHHIDWCLGLLDSLLDGTPWPEDATRLDPRIYDVQDREEMAATREFLRAFRAIPEDDRIEPGDTECFDATADES